MISLMTEKWMPVRRKTGRIDWIAPCQIVEDDILAFAANRPDFNGALAQMMVGLLQTTSPVNTEGDWEEFVDSPPNTELLQKWFTPLLMPLSWMVMAHALCRISVWQRVQN